MTLKKVPVIDAAEATHDIGYREEGDGSLTSLVALAGNLVSTVGSQEALAARVAMSEDRYHAGNPGLGRTNPADWEIRTGDTRFYEIVQVRPVAGIVTFDRLLAVRTTLDVATRWTLQTRFVFGGGTSGVAGPDVLAPIDLPAGDQRFVLAAERGPTASNRVFEVLELRLPYSGFALRLELPEGAPSSGEVFINDFRRF